LWDNLHHGDGFMLSDANFADANYTEANHTSYTNANYTNAVYTYARCTDARCDDTRCTGANCSMNKRNNAACGGILNMFVYLNVDAVSGGTWPLWD
jgi:uncharacterized protein YjbI with pentapeptide repeats